MGFACVAVLWVFGCQAAADPSARAVGERWPVASAAAAGQVPPPNEGELPAAAAPDVQDFVNHAAQSGRAVIGLARLAQRRSRHAGVEAFAESLVDQHRTLLEELSELAVRSGAVLPNRPARGHAAEEQRLGRLSGDPFDRAYLQQVVKGHDIDLKLFEQAARLVDNDELRAWAARVLPRLRAHRDEAQGILDGLTGATTSNR